jgi:hypothetical protein
MFIVIKFYKNHHVIIDKHGKILEYQYRIKLDLLRTLKEITKDFLCIGVNTSN